MSEQLDDKTIQKILKVFSIMKGHKCELAYTNTDSVSRFIVFILILL